MVKKDRIEVNFLDLERRDDQFRGMEYQEDMDGLIRLIELSDVNPVPEKMSAAQFDSVKSAFKRINKFTQGRIDIFEISIKFLISVRQSVWANDLKDLVLTPEDLKFANDIAREQDSTQEQIFHAFDANPETKLTPQEVVQKQAEKRVYENKVAAKIRSYQAAIQKVKRDNFNEKIRILRSIISSKSHNE